MIVKKTSKKVKVEAYLNNTREEAKKELEESKDVDLLGYYKILKNTISHIYYAIQSPT